MIQAGSATTDADGAFVVTCLEESAFQVSTALQVEGEAVWRGLVEGVSAGAGEWELTATAPDHVRLNAVTATLPGQEQAELVLVLERRAGIFGAVLDAGGAPVPGARVRAEDGTRPANPWMEPGGVVTEAGADGEFYFDELRPGTVTLVAQADGWADSEELVVEALPGETREQAVLTLRVDGRIEGTLATPEGDPLSGKRVVWGENAMGFDSRDEARTDASGRFTFEHVTPATGRSVPRRASPSWASACAAAATSRPSSTRWATS